MLFKDRFHAGELLAERMAHYRGRSPLILAVPRGGVEVALPIRRSLGGDLDLLITRKIGAPYQPELALGAVNGEGFIMLNEALAGRMNVPRDYIERIAAAEKTEIARRMLLYRGERPLPEVDGRLVLLVDDGVATGFTLLAALQGLHQREPEKIILAVPVGPPDTLDRLRPETDELYCLESPSYFVAVGQYYRNFSQVSDTAVMEILEEARNL